jgi:hypothetical protein
VQIDLPGGSRPTTTFYALKHRIKVDRVLSITGDLFCHLVGVVLA